MKNDQYIKLKKLIREYGCCCENFGKIDDPCNPKYVALLKKMKQNFAEIEDLLEDIYNE